MKSPAISVCISMYNAAPFLKDCIDSILSQSFTDFELLIVDDGSTDDSKDIVRSYHDNRIRLIENEHDYIGSLNILLKEAKGKYIARMDADDLMMPNRLELQIAYMEAHADIDILGGAIKCFNGQSEKIFTYGCDLIKAKDLLEGPVLAHPTVMMRTSSISNLSYDRNYIYAEDLQLWCQAFIHGLKLVNIPDVLTKYRITEKNTSFVYRAEQQQAASKARFDFEETITSCEAKYAWPIHTPIPSSHKKLTVIITFLNEGKELEHTLAGIRQSVADAVDIIVINDGSYDGYSYGEMVALYKAYYIVNRHRLGVAASRDLGVTLCQTPFFLLLDAHMRFYDGCWVDRIVRELSENDRQIICCQCRCLFKDITTDLIFERKDQPIAFGAFSPFAKNDIWPDIAWNYKEFSQKRKSEDVPTILGAAYAASKTYWQRLGGLRGLRNYGADEQFISIKAWREGGNCTLLKDVVIGHIFREQAPYKIMSSELVFNLILIAKLTFPVEMYCETVATSIIKNRKATLETLDYFEEHKGKLKELNDYFESIFVRDMEDIIPMHTIRREYDSNAAKKAISKLPDIVQFVNKNIPFDDGLMLGKTGVLLWVFHYDKFSTHSDLTNLAIQLYGDIETDIKEKRLPWNFKHGVAGIGWALLYFYKKKFIQSIPDLLINEIDAQISAINPDLLNDYSLETGAAGILAYFTLRMTMEGFDNSHLLLDKWNKKAREIFITSSQREAIYYAYLFQMMFEDTNRKRNCPHTPLLGIWLNAPLFLPNKINKQNCVLSNGILGTTLYAMSLESIK